MRLTIFLSVFLAGAGAWAAARAHSVSFGKTMTVPWFTGADEQQKRQLNIRPLYVDDKLKEFTAGEQHIVTDRTFVIRRVFRINDALPEDGSAPRWKWQRDGWLLVDRQSGRISELKLPEFDSFYSAVSWYRDYAAYCGVNSDADKLYAVVAEIGNRKPVVRKELGAFSGGEQPDSACPAPQWQRQPARVTFHPPGLAAMSFAVHGTSAEPAETEEEEK